MVPVNNENIEGEFENNTMLEDLENDSEDGPNPEGNIEDEDEVSSENLPESEEDHSSSEERQVCFHYLYVQIKHLYPSNTNAIFWASIEYVVRTAQ